MRSTTAACVAALLALTACSSSSGPDPGAAGAQAASSSPRGDRHATASRSGSAAPSASSTAVASPPDGGADPTPISLAFGGDVHFESMIRARLDRDPATALGPVGRVLSRADLAMVNLETAVTERGTPQPKAFHFRAPPSAFTALRGAGVDMVTQANNHGMDYGPVGLRDSVAAARRADFPVIGIGLDEDQAWAPYRVTVKGQRVAIVAATNVIDDILIPDWTAGPDKLGVASAKRRDRLVQAVRQAREGADTVVVYLHWGAEGSSCPTDEQRELERLMVEAGADIVVGSHAHLLLGGGWDRRGPYVDYGLGNFAFYSTGVNGKTESGVLELDVTGHRVTDARWVPARITGGIPLPQTGRDGRAILAAKEAARGCTGLLSSPPG